MSRTPPNEIRWPAEWEPQDGVLLAWPDERMDWRPLLAEARRAVASIAAHTSRTERVLVLAREPAAAREALLCAGAQPKQLTVMAADLNDTWTRDFGPLTVYEEGQPCLLDFIFNGWGGKYPATLDDVAIDQLAATGVLHAPVRKIPFVLEGGSLDTDGQGTALTTHACLLHPNRNPQYGPAEIGEALRKHLGVERILWLRHGYLAGDDTDSHVDMLARFAPDDTLLYVRCDDPNDEHYAELQAMEKELREFRTADGRPYRLLPLPWPKARYDEQGARLPLSYANFLVINEGVLVPVYRDPADAVALKTVAAAFSGRSVIPIDASSLIRQHGAVHCMTMQLPKGVLA